MIGRMGGVLCIGRKYCFTQIHVLYFNLSPLHYPQEGTLDYSSELLQLQKEGELPLDQLLASLPPEILEGKPLPSMSGDEEGEKKDEERMEEGNEVPEKMQRGKRWVGRCRVIECGKYLCLGV